MPAFTDVLHLLANEFACLGARRLALALVLTGALHRLSFRHGRISCGEPSVGHGFAEPDPGSCLSSRSDASSLISVVVSPTAFNAFLIRHSIEENCSRASGNYVT